MESFGYSAWCRKVGKLVVSDQVHVQDTRIATRMWRGKLVGMESHAGKKKGTRTFFLIRHEMGLNRADFARLVGLSERSVATWEAGADLKESSLRTIVEIGRLYAKLRQSFASPEQLATWLKTPNKAFGGSQPLQVIERGEIDRVWRMIHFLESGSPG